MEKKRIIRFILFLTFSIALLVQAVFFPSAYIFAVQPSAQATYIIKLRTSDQVVLEKLGSNIERRFGFAHDPNFKNIYSFRSPLVLEDLQNRLAGNYDYLEIEKKYSTQAVVQLNDPGFTTSEQNTNKQWGLVKAGFLEAWQKTTGLATNIIAVIDTGIDQTHEDLRSIHYVTGYNFISSSNITGNTNSDDNGHGTLVAGIIGATPNNGRGVVGTNWEISIMPIKALDSQGNGTSGDIAEAIVWATDHGAHIINLSLGGIGFLHDTTLANSISYAFNKNVLLIAAAGNDVAVTGGNLDKEPVFPICDDNGQNMIIGVAATDQNDSKPEFSNFGKACVDVSAPGKRILSTINHLPAGSNQVQLFPGAYSANAYAFASGTSVAVPFVAGEAALLRSLYPTATNKELRDWIISGADSVDNLNSVQCAGGSCAGLLGSGRINVAKSIEQAVNAHRILEGDLVLAKETNAIYYINGGKRQPVSEFVRVQRFNFTTPKQVSLGELETFPEGGYAQPSDGSLIRAGADRTVYYMSKGLRQPVTYQVFTQRNFNFANVISLSDIEVNSWLVGPFLSPPDGSLLKIASNPTVYWVISGVLHPVNRGYYISRGLDIFPIITVPAGDLKSFSKGEAFIAEDFPASKPESIVQVAGKKKR